MRIRFRHREVIRQRRPGQLVAVLIIAVAQMVCGESFVFCDNPSKLPVHRTFVPAKRPELWPAGDWVPIRPGKLDQLLTFGGVVSVAPARFQFSSAVYEATFDPPTQRLETGTATLIRASGAAEVSAFEPCTLALSDPHWSDRGFESDRYRRAILGTDLAGVKQLVTLRNAKRLSFDWSLAGRKRLTGIDFDIEVPRAVVTGFQITVPAGWQISSSSGVVYPVADESTARDAASKSRDAVLWRVDLGHLNQCRVRLHEPGTNDATQQSRITAFRVNSRFGSRSEWLEQSSEFTFEALPADVDEVAIAIPPELIVSSIESGSGRAFSWRDTGPQPDKWHVLRIQIPDASSLAFRTIVIRGNQPVPPPGSAQVPLRLEPPRPANAVLLSGSLSAVIESPYQIASYTVDGLRQTTTSVDEERHGLSFQQYSPQAELTLQIQNFDRQSSRKLAVREYSLLDVSAKPHRLQTTLDLTSQSQGVFESSWLVPRDWELTAVSLVPSTTAAAASSDNLSWSVSRSEDGHQKLTIDFADGLPVRKSLRILVAAQRVDSSGETESLVPVILPETARSVALVFGITGSALPDQSQISSNVYRRHTESEPLTDPGWSAMVASLASAPQAVWIAEYWALTDEIRTATLSLPKIRQENGGARSVNSSSIPPAPPTTKAESGSSDPTHDATVQGEHDSEIRSSLLSERMIVSAELDSRLSPGRDSRDLHRFTWKLHYSVPASPFRFQLPSDCELLTVTWRGQTVAPVKEGSEWAVPLAFVDAGDELSVDYTQPSQDVYLRETYRCRVPVAEVTIVGFDWRVRVRSRYSVVSFQPELTPGEEEQSSLWLSWCFGPLARRDSSGVFNPFEKGAWQRFLEGRRTDNSRGRIISRNDWKAFSASASELPASLSVHMCDHSRLAALSWFVLILSMLIGVLLRTVSASSRSQIALIWLSGCVASVTLVPGAYAELVGAAALGSILATLVPRRLVRPQRKQISHVEQVGMASTITRRIVTGSALLALMCLAASARGQLSAPNVERTIEVLVPFSDSPFKDWSEPDFVFIRNDDLSELSDSAMSSTENLSDLLITRTHWSVNVGESGSAEVLSRIDVAIHDEDARELEIPIPARFLAGQSECLVNGRSANILPNADGSRLRISLPELSTVEFPGRPEDGPPPPPLPEPVDLWREFSIQLRLRPLTVRSLDQIQTSLPVPAVVDSSLTLSFHSYPQTAFFGDPTTSSALRVVRPVEVKLGPAIDLKVGWHRSTPPTGAPVLNKVAGSLPSVEMRSAVEIHPTWMQRRTHARYLLTRQTVRYIAWRIPAHSQINFDQLRIRNLVDKSIRRIGEETVLTCEFDPPMTESFNFDLSWRQMQPESDAPSAIAWPRPVDPALPSAPLVVSSHLAGLSAETGFQPSLKLQSLATASDVDGAGFVAVWSENDRPRTPQMVFRVSDATQLVPDITPVRIQRTTRQSQIARIQPAGIQWTIYVEVDTAVLPAFSHEFRLPASFRIDSVTVIEDDVDRLSHWEHENGRLFLHLLDRRSGVQNITIIGQQFVPPSGAVIVPRMEAIEGVTAESTLVIRRSRQLQVEVEGANVIKDDSAPLRETPDTEEFVGRFRLLNDQVARIQVERVPVDPSAWFFAEISSENSDRIRVATTVDLEAISQRSIQIQLPAWAVSTGATVKTRVDGSGVAATVSADRATVDVKMPRPIPQHVRVYFNVMLDSPDGSALRLAPPTIRNIENQHGAIAVKHGPQGWKAMPNDPVSDLVVVHLDQFHLASETSAEQFVTWSDATRLTEPPSPSATRKIPTLVMHSIRPGIRHSGVSTTRILIQSEQPHVTLRWPRDARLISVRIDGHIENVLPPVAGSLRLPLGKQNSIHDVELLWSPNRESATLKVQRRSIPLPQLQDAPAGHVFVVATPSRGVDLISTAASPQSDFQAATDLSDQWLNYLLRFQRSSSAVDVGRRMRASLTTAINNPQNVEANSPLAGLADDLADVVTNVSSEPLQSEATGTGNADDSPTIIERIDTAEIGLWVVDIRINRILGSILIVVMVLPAFVLFLGFETGDRIARHPEICWLILGLIWWLCLKGSGAGFLLGVVSVLWIVGSYLQTRRHEAAALAES